MPSPESSQDSGAPRKAGGKAGGAAAAAAGGGGKGGKRPADAALLPNGPWARVDEWHWNVDSQVRILGGGMMSSNKGTKLLPALSPCPAMA